MNKKISAVVTLVGLILIMCAMAVLFHNKKEDNLAQKSSNTVLSSLKEKIEETEDAIKILRMWLGTEFKNGRYQERIDMIEKIEKENMK